MMPNPGLTTQPAFAADPDAPNTIHMIGGSDVAGNFAPGMVPVNESGVPTVLALDASTLAGNTILGSILTKLSSVVLATGAATIGAVTQAGNWVIAAGSNIIGRVGIDQTTPGVTNKVSLATDVVSVAPSGVGSGTDGSVNQPAPLTLLTTLTVTHPGAYSIQNQSQNVLQAIFDNGSTGSTTYLLAPGGDNYPGASAPTLPWFTGRIRVAGTPGSQLAARTN